MRWHPDVPDLPINKPKQIEKLEMMDRKSLDSMPPVEVKEKVDEIAHAVAKECKRQIKNCSYETCVEVVSVAMEVTGSAIGGHVGTAMIAAQDEAAKTACEIYFPHTS